MKYILSFAILSILIISCSSSEDEQDTTEKKEEVVVITTPKTKEKEKEQDNKVAEGERSLISQDLERTFLLRVPNSYDTEKKTPVVIVLHGYTRSGELIEKGTKFTPLSEKEDFIVVYFFR